MMRRVLVPITGLLACQSRPETASQGGPVPEANSGMSLQSSAFAAGQEIPQKYACEGDDVSPPLAWAGVPAGARSLALIVADPDAPDPERPKRTWVHWVLFGLPAEDGALPEAVSKDNLPPGTHVGKNDWGRTDYGGPCPPIGRHRYFFSLYALDAVLPALQTPTKAQLEQAMTGHVIAKAELIGTYQKHRSE